LIPDLALIVINTSKTSGLGIQLASVYAILEEHVQLMLSVDTVVQQACDKLKLLSLKMEYEIE